MGFKSNGINDFDIEALKREQEEKKRLAKLEEERAAAEKKRLEEEALKQQELQKQEEQAISNDTEVVELQDTPDGLTMMGEDGNEISIDKEQNGKPVDVSTDITEDTASESQTSDTVINDTESEDEIKSEEATLETLDNAYLDEVMKQQPEEEEPQDEVSRLLKQIYADEEAAKKAKKAKEEKEEKEKKQKGKKKKKKKKKSAKNNKQKAGYSHSIYGENDDDDYDDDDKGISRFIPVIGIVVVVIAVIALIAVGINATNYKKNDEPETTSYDQASNPLQEDSYEDISDVVKLYYQAKAAGDVNALAQYVDNMDGITEDSLAEESSYITGYSDITCYTKNGLYANTYVVFVRYSLQIKNIATPAPGISILYVIRDDETGNIYIHNGVTDKEVLDYISMISQDDDVVALYTEVNNSLNDALNADGDLKNFYDALAAKNNANQSTDDGAAQ